MCRGEAKGEECRHQRVTLFTTFGLVDAVRGSINNSPKQINASVAYDRSSWLSERLRAGDWHEIRKLRKGTRIYHGRLKSIDGNVVDSDQRAETFAQYLERVQWAVRPVSTMQFSHDLGPPLPVSMHVFSEYEVLQAAAKLKCNKACGPDLVPTEFWKCIRSNSTSRTWATQLCNSIWCHGDIPDDWHDAFVAVTFKKHETQAGVKTTGRFHLLSIGYKLFATVLLQRLLAAGGGSRIWHTQFGFRSQRGTADAIFVARRLIEQTWSKHEGRLVFVALDWAKAFDSISPEGLVHALRKFGLPSHVCDIVRNIYKGRRLTRGKQQNDSPSCQHSLCGPSTFPTPWFAQKPPTVSPKNSEAGRDRDFQEAAIP